MAAEEVERDTCDGEILEELLVAVEHAVGSLSRPARLDVDDLDVGLRSRVSGVG